MMGSMDMTIMNSELSNAVINGLTDRVLELGMQGMKDHVTSEGHTILHLAAQSNKHITAEAILHYFPELLQQINNKTETALHLAARQGYYLVVRELIAASRASNQIQHFIRKAVKEDGNTALHLAVQKNHQRVVEVIVSADPTDTHSPNKKSETPLYLAAIRGNINVLELILNTCKDASVFGPGGKTALHAAVISRNADCVGVIMEKKSHLRNRVDGKQWTAMHYAAFHNCASLLQILTDKQSIQSYLQNSPNNMDNPLKTIPLHIAASEGHISALQEFLYLYRSSPIIEAVDENYQNILHLAVDNKHTEVVKCILQEYTIPDRILNSRDKNGNTPLHLLVMRGSFILELIRHPMVDRYVPNNDGFTAFELLYVNEDIVADQFKIKYALMESERKTSRKMFGGNKKSELMVHKSLRSNVRLKEVKFKKAEEEFKRAKAEMMKKDVAIYRERTNTQIIVTALITTVTFTVGFTLPGGYHQEEGNSNQGLAVLSKEKAFNIFMISDAVALLLSVSSLFLYFVSSIYQDVYHVSKLIAVSTGLNIVSVVAMMLTFITGTYVVLPHSTSLSIIVCVISGAFFPCVFFVLLVMWRYHPHYWKYEMEKVKLKV